MSTSSRDFSYFSLFTAGLACFVPLANASTQPTGSGPVGNPFSEPGLNSIVPVGVPYNVEWQPTTNGTITLVLLKGPSSNAIPQYAIVEGIPNNGLYAWTPATDLAPNTTGYGLQLIDDATGQYQYTTQFGISNPNYIDGNSASSSSLPSVNGSTTSTTSTTITSTAARASVTPIVRNSTTSSADSTTSAGVTIATASIVTYITPTAASTSTSATGSATPSTTGLSGAGSVAVSMGAVFAFAGLVTFFA